MPRYTLKRVVVVVAGLLSSYIGYNVLFVNTCRFKSYPYFTISTVGYGAFSEYIPQNGIVEYDSIRSTSPIVKVKIDELYVSRICTGLRGSTSIDGLEYDLLIVNVSPLVVDDSFGVDMKFIGRMPSSMENGQQLRLRLALTECSNEILLPIGGFYADTGGDWVFVIENGVRAIKRSIQIGHKNGDYFQIVDGLKPGDNVITSSYEEFIWKDSLSLTELERLKKM